MSDPHYTTPSMFNGSSHNSFRDSTFVIQSEHNAAFDRLEKAASPSAFHSYVGRPHPGTCYPNTRVALREGLEKWALGEELPENLFDAGLDRDEKIGQSEQLRNLPIIWLRGAAGAGKSAVAQTFAERCEDLGHIVASFFFFSTDSTRNTADRLVATLAYQIAREDSHARAHIETVVLRDPHIFNRDLKKQFLSLIVNPILQSTQRLPLDAHQRRCVVIIDGLDECAQDEIQAGIICALSNALHARSSEEQKMLPCFLICSRPEEPIMRVFRSLDLQLIHTSIDLSSDTKADDDIRTFLTGKFAEIKKAHYRADLIPASWPSIADVKQLLYNSSGHFIYAETVIRLVSDDSRPVLTLESILGLRALPQRTREPLADLDELYRHILRRALRKCNLSTVRYLLGIMATSSFRFLPEEAEEFLGFEDGEVDSLFRLIPSLVNPEEPQFYHKSCGDFLCDKVRAGEFYVGRDELCALVWAGCRDKMTEAEHLCLRGNGEIARFVTNCIMEYPPSCDFHLTQKSYSLDGMTQRRQFFHLINQFRFWEPYETSGVKGSWAAGCFNYWFELLRSAEGNGLLVMEATAAMTDIFKNLMAHCKPSVPLLMCRRLPPDFETYNLPSHANESVLEYDSFTKFLQTCSNSRMPTSPFFERTYLSALTTLMETEGMGHHRLTGRRYAESCVFWILHLTKSGNPSTFRSKEVIEAQHSLIPNESIRQIVSPFRWRMAKRTIRPHQTDGRLFFLHPESSWFYPYSAHNPDDPEERTDECERLPADIIRSNDRNRCRMFKFILSRIPAMLTKAAKSDAVAALRFKAFPPHATRFPRLTRRARQALEQYALRHGYTPSIDPGDKYIASMAPNGNIRLSGAQGAVSIAAPLQQLVIANPAMATSIPTQGHETLQPHFFPSYYQSLPGVDICGDPYCRMVIGSGDWFVVCGSPDCNRRYYLHCQRMEYAPLTEWFCDEACERDVSARKRARYSL